MLEARCQQVPKHCIPDPPPDGHAPSRLLSLDPTLASLTQSRCGRRCGRGRRQRAELLQLAQRVAHCTQVHAYTPAPVGRLLLHVLADLLSLRIRQVLMVVAEIIAPDRHWWGKR